MDKSLIRIHLDFPSESDKQLIIFALSYLNDIAIRITHVATDLRGVVFWLSKELCPFFSPLLIIPLDVRHTNIDEVISLIWVARRVESHCWFNVGWAPAYV